MNRAARSPSPGVRDRTAFVAYFLGAVVPLGALAFAIGEYTALREGSLTTLSLFAPMQSAHLLALFASISTLSLACFFLLRRLVIRSIHESSQLHQFDSLTGLPNRRLFMDRAEQALRYADLKGELLAIFFIDLDSFKRANDRLGHSGGDELLLQVAKRLVSVVRLSDPIARVMAKSSHLGLARLGGDEFTLVLSGISDERDADSVARRVLEALRAPFYVANHELHVTASLGIAVYPSDGEDIEALLKSADTAMYYAKDEGKNNYKFFSASMNQEIERAIELETRLCVALSRGGLSVHYQPVRHAETGRVVAAEALVRWDDSELGAISPAEFIPVAESSGLIDQIGEWVLRVACAQSSEWQSAGFEPIRMAVNLSAHQVRTIAFVERVGQVLRETGLGPADLELEITESTIMQEDEQIDRAFEALANMGVNLALDDFGTGYSSLTFLRRFPISRVKLDRSFVREIPFNAENLAVCAAIISMAHHLMLSVVGEGVETEEQAQSLRELGCEELQGFLFSPPVCGREFVQFLNRTKK